MSHRVDDVSRVDAKLGPLSAAIQNRSAGLSEHLSDSVTDARQLLERWTRENILAPDGEKVTRTELVAPAIRKSPAKIPTDTAHEVSPTVTGAATSPSSEISPPIPMPDASMPNEISKIVSDSREEKYRDSAAIELRPDATLDSDKCEARPSDTKSFGNANSGAVPSPRFVDRERLQSIKNAGKHIDQPPAVSASQREVESPTVPVSTTNSLESNDSLDFDRPFPKNSEPAYESAAAAGVTKPKFRIDASHPGPGDQTLLDMAFRSSVERRHDHEEPSPSAGFSLPRREPEVARKVHSAHRDLIGVHFDVKSPNGESKDNQPKQSTQSILGQILAYLGVGVLTLGAGCVLWGYFGAAQYSHLAPTGWLVTTAGQMLLFLGVVTLIAGGLEQTNALVNQRLDRWERQWIEFNGRSYRVDPASGDPMAQGPHVPCEAFQDSRSHSETSNTSSRT